MKWKTLKPNKEGDWINQRNDTFKSFISLGNKSKNGDKNTFFLDNYSPGIMTQRDTWSYVSSVDKEGNSMRTMINYYNQTLDKSLEFDSSTEKIKVLENHSDPKEISWTVNLRSDLLKEKKHSYNDKLYRKALYRPFFKQLLYFDKSFIERPGLNIKFFPKKISDENVVISCHGKGGNRRFSVIASDCFIDRNSLEAGAQCFPLYSYEERTKQTPGLFDQTGESEYIRHDGVSDFILKRATAQYGKSVTKEDIFYYVYGILHSPDYRETFKNDLKKMLPRLPLVDAPKDFWKFSKAGRALAELHINYESVAPYEGVEVVGTESKNYTVTKMRFPKKDAKHTILYNGKIKITNIPDKAYNYIVNGKSAIEWIMERYQVKTDKKSGITNNPNDWSKEHNNPSYIFDLLLSIINVSMQTVDIVEGLPKLEFD